MKFKYRPFQEPPVDLSESDVRICSSQFKALIGQEASANRLKPWKGRVVALSSSTGTIYRLLKGHGNLSIPSGVCWIGSKTRSQLDIHDNSEVEITLVSNQWWARCLYYNNHLDDAVRFSFRIGFWGLILAVVSLGFSLISILKP
jgi:hypothetical protein